MTQPGWYPDPDGTPHSVRWWDGERWTGHVRSAPGAPAPQPTGPLTGRAALGWLAGIVAFVVAASLVASWAPWRPATPAPTRTQAPAPTATRTLAPAPTRTTPRTTTPRPTATPRPRASEARVIAHCAPGSASPGVLTDGSVLLQAPAPWQAAQPPAWLGCGSSAVRQTPGGAVSLTVGRLASDEASDDLQAAAGSVWGLISLESASATRQIRPEGPTAVGGREAWRIDVRGRDASGTTLRYAIIAVDNRSPSPTILIAAAHEDDRAGLALLDEMLTTTQVR